METNVHPVKVVESNNFLMYTLHDVIASLCGPVASVCVFHIDVNVQLSGCVKTSLFSRCH